MPNRSTFNLSVVMILLLLNGTMFLLEMSSGGQLINSFALWPLETGGVDLQFRHLPVAGFYDHQKVRPGT